MSRQVNQVRIIAGRHRGRRLPFVPGPGLRPTPDRVRETLFNWMREEVPGARCLDLFAGSGALGLEALSRGASHLVAVDRQRRVAERLRDNTELLEEQDRVEVVNADVVRFLSSKPGRPFEIVFLDPPFASDLLATCCERLEENGWLAESALVYVEQSADRPWPDMPANWHRHREGQAGQSAHRLLRRTNDV